MKERVASAKSRVRRGVPQPGRHTRPGPREKRGLLLLVWAGFLSTSQYAQAAGYPSLRRAQRRLRVLLDQGLTRVELQNGALHLPSLHVPTQKAFGQLVDDGQISADDRVPRLPRAQKRAHALLVRDIFAAFAAAEAQGQLRLDDFQFDSDLGRMEPFRTVGLIPDGIATMRGANNTVTIAIEADTGSETTTTLRKKFTKWRAVLDVWNPPGLTLLVVAERQGRRQTLARLMSEARLDEIGVALLVSEARSFVDGVAAPFDLAARGNRAERRGGVVQVRDIAEAPGATQPAFRVLVR